MLEYFKRMASDDHLNLSDFIKSVHQKLRDDAKLLGAENAWKKHCQDANNLEKYATAMQNLAVNHWESNCKKNETTVSRVQWIYEFAQKYFNEAEIVKHRQREIEIALKINLQIDDLHSYLEASSSSTKLQVLDVGSCYNPFKIYQNFNVIPIDIAPANREVYKCDFLALKLTTSKTLVNNSLEISELQCESFDIVIFSLLLEYLPSPNQRYTCCEKAYGLLKSEGILIIVTPDSKHVGANAKIMKSWRFILSKMGFSRIKYEKLSHLHCMVFRKSIKREVAQRWASLQDQQQFYSKIYIPQDFKKVEEVLTEAEHRESCDISLFDALPFVPEL